MTAPTAPNLFSLAPTTLACCAFVLATDLPAWNARALGCMDEIKRVCGPISDDADAVHGCTDEHFNEFSPQCQKSISVDLRLHMVDHACKSETESKCADITPGDGRVMTCLRAHLQDLSAVCAKTLDGAWKAKHVYDFWRTCGRDSASLCTGVTTLVRVAKCLRGKREQLTPPCRELLESDTGFPPSPH